MLKVAFKTLGCRFNRLESDELAKKLEDIGYSIVNTLPADLIVVNTCTVTNEADRKSRQSIRNMKKRCPKAKIAVMGCGTRTKDNRYDSMEENDYVLKHGTDIIDFLKGMKIAIHQAKTEAMTQCDSEEVNIDQHRTRALVKIQNGCNEFCSFCIVPFTRGRSVSMKKEEILDELLQKENEGALEVVLTGINIGDYKDPHSGENLPQLLEYILKKSNIQRIRLTSLNPNYFDKEFYEVLKNPRICPHIHLSIQSGSTDVLEKMKRKYDKNKILEVMDSIHSSNADVAFTSDIIAGFPGENNEQFLESLNTVEMSRFAHLHVFPYSVRTGTAAATLKDQVDPQIKKERARLLREASERSQQDFLATQYGKKRPVLFEQSYEDGTIRGLTDNYIRISIPREGHKPNTIEMVELTERNVVGVG